MIRSCLFLFLMVLSGLSNAQISISSTTTPHTQNFNTLRSSSGASNTLPTGWRLTETGSGANSRYTVDAGSNTAGDTYSYGAVNNTERSLGCIRSSSVTPVFGAQFRNTTGRTITSLIISYTGEQWRCGATGRGADRLDFQFSLNASSLTNGTWVDNNTLDFSSMNVTSVGARNGNLAENRSLRSTTISGLSIANNAIFWIRWTDFDASGADDGLAIDDFSIQLSSATLPPPQPALDTLKVVSWNIEWFGGSLGPADDNLQQQNVQTILKNINADIYALQEVVSASRLQSVVSQMPGYSMIIGDDFCSNGVQVSSCVSAQKLAYIYNTNKVTLRNRYPVLRAGSANASYNWSSGRFPYLMDADVTINGATQRLVLVNVHAKANTSDFIVSYNRRKAGSDELRDSLNTQYGNNNVIVLGDLNDDLDRTITTQVAPDTTTSWIAFKADNINYSLPTLPLSMARIPSTASFPDIIDHAIISNELNTSYVTGSARVLKSQVEGWIPSYSTTTSDHYPVEVQFIWSSGTVSQRKTTSSASVKQEDIRWTASGDQIRLMFNNPTNEIGHVNILDVNGRLLYTNKIAVGKGENQQLINVHLPANGMYLIQLTRGTKRDIIKMVK